MNITLYSFQAWMHSILEMGERIIHVQAKYN